MEFTNRESKFEKEQKVRREALKKKREAERAAQARHAEKEREQEERRVKKREEDERRHAEENAAKLADEALTGGITFTVKKLTPYVIDGEDDKVILPESCIVDLSNLDVFGKGPILMRLSKEDGKFTHSGVREFSAPAGSIGLPRKVVFTLTGGISVEELTKNLAEEDRDASVAATLGLLSIKYVVMPKATYAKLRPLHNAFSSVKPVKDMLEENLRFHSTLSVGDLLTVWYRGVSHNLRVCEMLPQEFGSLVDTDVSIDLDVSEEYTQKMEERGDTKKIRPSVVPPASAGTATEVGARLVESEAATGSGRRVGLAPGDGMGAEGMVGEGEKGGEDTSKYMELPVEPGTEEPSSITVRLKLSDGTSVTRRMRATEELGFLFELASRQVGGGVKRSMITLSTRFPARTLAGTADSAKTFVDIGLRGGQETFFVAVK